MKNILTSIFNFGSINQSNTEIINTAIDTQIKQIKRTFSEGKIALSFDDIFSARQEHSLNEKARYHFLMLETQFYFTLRNFEKVIENLEYLKKNLYRYLDVHYYEIKASIVSLEGDKKTFNEIMEKIQKEFNGDKNLKEYQDIIFLLNSKKSNEAMSLYEEYIASGKVKDKRIEFLGGIIYSNLYFSTNKQEYLDKSEQIFNNYLEVYETDFFDKLEIYKLFSIDVVNKLLSKKEIIDYKIIIEQTKDTLEVIINDLDYFGADTKMTLENHYMHCLWILNEPELFSKKYISIKEDDVDHVNFYFYNLQLNIKNLDYEKIEKRILLDEKLLIPYVDALMTVNPHRILDYLENNKHYLNNEIVLNIFVSAQIKINKKVELDTLVHLEHHKNDSLVTFLAYLESFQLVNGYIENDSLEKLIHYFDDTIIHEICIIKAMNLLYKNNKQKEYITLGLKYKDSFFITIKQTLEFMYEDKNIYLSDFEDFISKIDQTKYYILIGNIYLKYSIFRKSYEYYKLAWNILDSDIQYKINFACTSLQNCSIQNFFRNNNEIIDPIQDKVYITFLESNSHLLTIQQAAILSYYLIVVDKAYTSGFKYINEKLLAINISSLGNDEKNILSTLYFYLISQKPEVLLVPSNTLINCDDILSILEKRYESIDKNYNLHTLNQMNFDIALHKKESEQLSIFHFICNRFISSMESEHFTYIKSTKDDPLDGIKEMLHQQSRNEKEKLSRFSKGKDISFYKIVGGNYENYFTLIPMLLESKEINFCSGNNNPTPQSTKKILTLSSIIFINYFGKLDFVLARKDIFIQQTTINFLLNYIKSLNKETEIMTIKSNGKDLFKNIANEKDIKQSQDYLITLARKVSKYDRIIDDTEEVLALAAAESHLSSHIGRQEFKALAFSYNNNYQIITEDRILTKIFDSFNYNMNMVSNSAFLLFNDSKEEELISLYKSLNEKKYLHILNENYIKNLYKKYVFEEYTYTTRGLTSEMFNITTSLAYSYGWMDDFETYYENNYAFKIGMTNPPKKDFIAKNIEYLREINNYTIESNFPKTAVLALEEAKEKALKEDKSIVISDNGKLYKLSPDGSEDFIKNTDEKISVNISKKIKL